MLFPVRRGPLSGRAPVPGREHALRVALASFVLSLLAGGLVAQPSPGRSYVSRGEVVRLERDPDRFSIGLAGADPERAFRAADGREATVRPLGGAVARLSAPPGAIPSVRLIDFSVRPAAASSRPGVSTRVESGAAIPRPTSRRGEGRDSAATLEALRSRADVTWAYPAWREPGSGALVFLTPLVVVHFDRAVDETELRTRLPSTVEPVRRLRTRQPGWLVRLTDPASDEPFSVATTLRDLPGVRSAVPDFVQDWQRQAVPDDPLYPQQWHLANDGSEGLAGADARLEGAWEVQTGQPSTVLAVLDDGLEASHPDLTERVFGNPAEIPSNGVDDDDNGYVDDVAGWDFFDDDNDPSPLTSEPSHGTAVSGIAAAHGDNGLGVSGACPDCSVLPVRIAGATFASDALIAEAIEYAGQFGDVLSNSWGGGAPSEAITSAAETVSQQARGGLGAPVVFSSGNSATGYVTATLTFPAGSFVVEWVYRKDETVSAGFDTAWLDNVLFPGGELFTFEDCALPVGWITGGDANWTVEDDETRSASTFGGRCSLRAGRISDGEESTLSTTRTFAEGGDLIYQLWPSAERLAGEGPIGVDDECFDGASVRVYDADDDSLLGEFLLLCGTFATTGRPLADGTVGYPASIPDTVAVGASTNWDTRSDYSQWGPGLDLVAPSSGGTLGIWTTDLVGAAGYSPDDYTGLFGGTSASAPLVAGILGLWISEDEEISQAEIRARLRDSTRRIGTLPYSDGRNDVYGWGVVSAERLLVGSGIFSDDFESGGLGSWSAVTR